MMKSIRQLLYTAMASVALLASPVGAQDFPQKPVRMVIGFPPGGTPDVIARALAQPMGGALGQPILVDNKVGAGGLNGIQDLLRSPADGYSILMADVSVFAILPAMRPGVYDPTKDLIPLGNAITSPVYLMINSGVPAKTFPEFVDLAKSKPGQYSYGTPGVGTLHHFFMEAIKLHFGLNIQHVPFKGVAQMTVSLVGGDVQAGIVAMTAARPFIRDGKIRAIAASTRERDPVLSPDVPTVYEFGAKDIDYAGDIGLFAPVRTPKAAVDKLAAAVAKAVQDPDFVAKAPSMGANALYRNPEVFGESVRASYARFQNLIKATGIQAQ